MNPSNPFKPCLHILQSLLTINITTSLTLLSRCFNSTVFSLPFILPCFSLQFYSLLFLFALSITWTCLGFLRFQFVPLFVNNQISILILCTIVIINLKLWKFVQNLFCTKYKTFTPSKIVDMNLFIQLYKSSSSSSVFPKLAALPLVAFALLTPVLEPAPLLSSNLKFPS